MLGVTVNGVAVSKVEGYIRNRQTGPAHGSYDLIGGLREKLEASAFYQNHGYAFVAKHKTGQVAVEALILYGKIADATLGLRVSDVTKKVLDSNGELTFVNATGIDSLQRASTERIRVECTPGMPAFAHYCEEDKNARLKELKELERRRPPPPPPLTSRPQPPLNPPAPATPAIDETPTIEVAARAYYHHLAYAQHDGASATFVSVRKHEPAHVPAGMAERGKKAAKSARTRGFDARLAMGGFVVEGVLRPDMPLAEARDSKEAGVGARSAAMSHGTSSVMPNRTRKKKAVLPFEEALVLAHSLNLKTQNEWTAWSCTSCQHASRPTQHLQTRRVARARALVGHRERGPPRQTVPAVREGTAVRTQPQA